MDFADPLSEDTAFAWKADWAMAVPTRGVAAR